MVFSPSREWFVLRVWPGSVERMMAILIEHTGGRWPFWLSPRQITVCPVRSVVFGRAVNSSRCDNRLGSNCLLWWQVSEHHLGYATSVFQTLQDGGLYVDMDASARTVPKRVRAAQVAQYNLIVVVGDKEKDTGTVSVRCRDSVTLQSVKEVAGLGDSSEKDETLLMTLPQLVSVCNKLKIDKL